MQYDSKEVVVKTIITIFILVIAASVLSVIYSCGGATEEPSETKTPPGQGKKHSKNQCADSPLVGNWEQTGNGVPLVFRPDCTGAESDCDLVLTYTNDDTQLFAHVTSTNGDPGCPPDEVADYVCDYEYPVNDPGFPGEDLLEIDCGDGPAQDWYGTQLFRFVSEVPAS